MDPSKNGYDPSDIQDNKGMAAIAYILFFVPLIAAKESKFAMYHTNQGLTLFVTAIAANMALGLIPALGWLLLPFVNLALLALAIWGLATALQGLVRPLPVIGAYTLLK